MARESVEAPFHHADELCQGETHGHDGPSPIDRESAGLSDRGVLDVGMGDDVLQGTPGMEVDMIMETSRTSRSL